jgi:hypothetical protein
VETVPKRGYRFIGPVEAPQYVPAVRTDLNLQKALWLNIAELRLAEVRRHKFRRRLITAAIVAGVLAAAALMFAFWR